MADSSGPPLFDPNAKALSSIGPASKLPKTSTSPDTVCPPAPKPTVWEKQVLERKNAADAAAKVAPPLKGHENEIKQSLDLQDRSRALIEADKIFKQTVMCGPEMHTCSVNYNATTAPNLNSFSGSAYKTPSQYAVDKLCDALPTNHAADFHADQKLVYEYYVRGGSKLPPSAPFPPMGDSRDMCADCQQFFAKLAIKSQQDIVTSDPRGTRVFHADGSVTKISRSNGYYAEMGPNPSWPADLSTPGVKVQPLSGTFTDYPDGTRKVWSDTTSLLPCPYVEKYGPDGTRTLTSLDGKRKKVVAPDRSISEYQDGKLVSTRQIGTSGESSEIFYGPDGNPTHRVENSYAGGAIQTTSVPSNGGWETREKQKTTYTSSGVTVETTTYENGTEKSSKTDTMTQQEWTEASKKKRDFGST